MTVRDELLRLLERVGDAFQRSEIAKTATSAGRTWGYSLITGSCVPKALLIVGFNWGARAEEHYPSQRKIEEGSWKKGDLGSLARILPYLNRYFPEASLTQISQTNYCFFRSKNERQIRDSDLDLCQPIFEELLRIMTPSLILSFSSRLRDRLLRKDAIGYRQERMIHYSLRGRKVTYLAVAGELDSGTPVLFLPHPNYPMRTEARESAWGFCADTIHHSR